MKKLLIPLALVVMVLTSCGGGGLIPPPPTGGPLEYTGPSTLTMPVNTPYSTQLQVKGGNGVYTWKNATGLPPGMAVDGSGKLTGTPTKIGTYTMTIQISSGN